MALQVLKMVAALAAVLSLIFILMWLAKKLNLARALGEGGQRGWRVLSSRALGPRRQVYLLEVGSKLLVIGATEKSLTTLTEVHDPAERDLILSALENKKRASNRFDDFLRKAQS
jgi:flagellar biosynthetic protein FliO